MQGLLQPQHADLVLHPRAGRRSRIEHKIEHTATSMQCDSIQWQADEGVKSESKICRKHASKMGRIIASAAAVARAGRRHSEEEPPLRGAGCVEDGSKAGRGWQRCAVSARCAAHQPQKTARRRSGEYQRETRSRERVALPSHNTSGSLGGVRSVNSDSCTVRGELHTHRHKFIRIHTPMNK